MNSLAMRLERLGLPTAMLAGRDGSRVLIWPRTGRVLGLYASGSENNFLWTNPVLEDPTSALALLASDSWFNPGGDRTWLAPETELFLGDLQRPFETYAVPHALDPGNWGLASATDTELRLENTTRLRLRRRALELGVRISKRYRLAANPLLGTAPAKRGLQFAGYAQVTILELEPLTEAGIRLGIWNLLQLPAPGTMLIPTTGPERPQLVFGALSAAELRLESRQVRWRMSAPGANSKIALKSSSLTGRAGYLRQQAASGIAELVVRQFQADPSGDYVDALWTPPHETGWAFQACCIRSGAERFNELEYHGQAATAAAGASRRRDESCVWAFRGPAEAIAEAAEVLLERSDQPSPTSPTSLGQGGRPWGRPTPAGPSRSEPESGDSAKVGPAS